MTTELVSSITGRPDLIGAERRSARLPAVSCNLVALAGQLGGTPEVPDVRGLRESGGTLLAMGLITDGEFLKRTGATIVSQAGGGGGYTDEQAQDAVGTILLDSATIDFTYDDPTPSITAIVINDSITFAKMQNVATDRLLGRDTAATGDVEELTVGGGMEFTGSGGVQRSALTGDVTATAGSGATAIADNAVTNADLRDSAGVSVVGRAANSSGDPADIVAGANDRVLRRTADVLDFGQLTVGMSPDDLWTYAKIQNVSATSRILGRITADAGDIEELTGTQATTLLDDFTSALKGLAPSSGGGTINFLRADGTWTAPTVEGWTIVVKSADQNVVNAGVTADTELKFAIGAAGGFAVQLDLWVSGDHTTGDYIMDLQLSAGTMKGKGSCQNLGASGAVQNIIVTAAAAANTTGIVTGAPTADLDDLVAVRLTFAFVCTAGATMTFRFGNSAPAAGRTSRTKKGSILRWKSLA